jgi:cold shock CspA family protein
MPENRFRGVVRTWNFERCFGRLSVDARGAMIPFHISEVLNACADEIRPGDAVEFGFGEFQQRVCAIQVKFIGPTAPTIPAAKAGA